MEQTKTIKPPKQYVRNKDIAKRMSQAIPELKHYQMGVLIKLYWSEVLKDAVMGKKILIDGVGLIKPTVKRYRNRVIYSGHQKIKYTTDVVDPRIPFKFRKPIREQLRQNAIDGKVEIIEVKKEGNNNE